MEGSVESLKPHAKQTKPNLPSWLHLPTYLLLSCTDSRTWQISVTALGFVAICSILNTPGNTFYDIKEPYLHFTGFLLFLPALRFQLGVSFSVTLTSSLASLTVSVTFKGPWTHLYSTRPLHRVLQDACITDDLLGTILTFCRSKLL